MLTEFRIGLDAIATSSTPGFLDEEVYSLLNKAEDYIILESYKSKEYNNIYTLVKETTSILLPSPVVGVRSNALPNDFWLYVESYSSMTRSGIDTSGFIPNLIMNGSLIENLLIDAKDARKYAYTAFNTNKIIRQPYCYYSGNNINFITDDYTTTLSYVLKYIKKKLIISSTINSELPESIHRVVVDQAIKLAQQSLFSQLPNKQ